MRRPEILFLLSLLLACGEGGPALDTPSPSGPRTIPAKTVVLQFHGVPEPSNPNVSTTPEAFQRYMQYLDDEGYRVIAMRDLEPYLDRSRLPPDPMRKVRCPK